MLKPGMRPGLTNGVRPSVRLTAGLRQGIALMALSGADLLAWASVAAADNPAIRIRIPDGPAQGARRVILDPEALAAPGGSLITHVLAQIPGLGLTPRARAIALVLVEALEPTGWLGTAPARLARICGATLEELEVVLAQLQRLEPAGIFARSLAECLRIQALAEGVHSPAMQVVLDHLPQLAAGDLAGIAADFGLDPSEIGRAARALRGFDPKPGLAFADWQPPAHPPDFVLERAGGTWRASRDPTAPVVEVAPGGSSLRELSHALEHRAATSRRVCDHLARVQTAWLDGGDPVVVTTRALAEALDLHVSTANRLLSATVIRGPRGTMALRALIAPPLHSGGPPVVLARARLAELLADPGTQGWSDRRLAEALVADGILIARRTVAKYRAALAAG